MVTLVFISCEFKSRELTAKDIELWKHTPAWKLAKAVKVEDTLKIKKILSEGNIKIDHPEPKYGITLLYWAVWNNKLEMTEFLLSQGANPNFHIFFNGRSPVTVAAFQSDIEILSTLLHYGGNPNDHILPTDSVTYERTSATPLSQAACWSLPKVKLLVESGADLYLGMKPGFNPLVQAAIMKNFKVVRYFLIDCGMDYSQSYTVIANGDTLRIKEILSGYYNQTEENMKLRQEIFDYIDQQEQKKAAQNP